MRQPTPQTQAFLWRPWLTRAAKHAGQMPCVVSPGTEASLRFQPIGRWHQAQTIWKARCRRGGDGVRRSVLISTSVPGTALGPSGGPLPVPGRSCSSRGPYRVAGACGPRKARAPALLTTRNNVPEGCKGTKKLARCHAGKGCFVCQRLSYMGKRPQCETLSMDEEARGGQSAAACGGRPRPPL